jgi:hypothetical protein
VNVPARNPKRRFAAILGDLDIPQPFDLSQFLASLALQRQRMIFLHPFTSGPGVPCGVWLATARADHIFHESSTTAWHVTQIVLHEIAHMLLGHRERAQSSPGLASLLAPDLDQALIRLILGRSAYATAEEQDAETLASLIVQRATAAAASRPAAGCGTATPGPVAALMRQYARRMPVPHTSLGMWAAYWRLRPLWLILSRAAPDVRLPRQPGTRFSARYRLHRRVIEIRDAELSLRPYRNGTAAGQAMQSPGFASRRREAAAGAAAILAALAPAGHAEALTRDDLAAETARLIQAARAIRCSVTPGGAVRRPRSPGRGGR